MSSLHPIAGFSESLERARNRPLIQLQKMNRHFYAALKLDELDFTQHRVFTKCLEPVPIPGRLDDKDVIAALADPDRSFLEDYEATDLRFRRRWHFLLTGHFYPDSEGRERAVKERLGRIRRVLKL